MPHILATLAAVVLLALPTTPTASVKPDPQQLLESVRPLQWIDADSFGDLHLWVHCTTSSINTTRRLWLTAAHCVADGTGSAVASHEFFVDGHHADVVLADFDADLAVLVLEDESDYSAPALRLAKHASAYLDAITIAGYPYGFGPLVATGVVTRPVITLTGGDSYTMLAVSGCPGNSGSPVVNGDGDVISVVQVGFNSGCTGVMGGAPYRELVRVAGSYFEK